MLVMSCVVIVASLVTFLLTNERMRRVSALKGEFVANVSHELKTPLALVRMFGEMLQSGRVASEAKRQEYLDIIVGESERLSGLIENVLDFAKVERGRDAYDFADGDVGEAVAKAANVYRYRAEREAVKLAIDIAPGLPHRADRRARYPARGHQPRRQRAQIRAATGGRSHHRPGERGARKDLRAGDRSGPRRPPGRAPSHLRTFRARRAGWGERQNSRERDRPRAREAHRREPRRQGVGRSVLVRGNDVHVHDSGDVSRRSARSGGGNRGDFSCHGASDDQKGDLRERICVRARARNRREKRPITPHLVLPAIRFAAQAKSKEKRGRNGLAALCA